MAHIRNSQSTCSAKLVKTVLARAGIALPRGLSVTQIIRSSAPFRQLVRSHCADEAELSATVVDQLQQCIDAVLLEASGLPADLLVHVAPARRASEEFCYWMSLLLSRAQVERDNSANFVRNALDVLRIASCSIWLHHFGARPDSVLMHCVSTLGAHFVVAVSALERVGVRSDTLLWIASSLAQASLQLGLPEDIPPICSIPSPIPGHALAQLVALECVDTSGIAASVTGVEHSGGSAPASGAGSFDRLHESQLIACPDSGLATPATAYVGDPVRSGLPDTVLRVTNAGRSAFTVRMVPPSNSASVPRGFILEVASLNEPDSDRFTFNLTQPLRDALRLLLAGSLPIVRVEDALSHNNLVVSRKGEGALVRAIGRLQAGIDVRLGPAQLHSLARIIR